MLQEGVKKMKEIKFKIYESMKEIPLEELLQHLKDCEIDPYDDLGSRSGKERTRGEIQNELKRRREMIDKT